MKLATFERDEIAIGPVVQLVWLVYQALVWGTGENRRVKRGSSIID